MPSAQEPPPSFKPSDPPPQDHQDPVVPPLAQDPVIPPQADEPKGEPLPVVGQTGWVLGDEEGVETRDPVDLLLAVTCVGRAQLGGHPLPASAQACRDTYPDIEPDGEKPWLQHMASIDQFELIDREGCTYVPAIQVAYCGWTFTKFFTEFNEERTYGLMAPFVPTFTPFVEQCGKDKPHYVSAAKVDEVNNDPSLPSGCLGWSELMMILESQEGYGFMRFDENGFPVL